MFFLAIGIGLYGFLIFFLGLLSLIHKNTIIVVSIFYWVIYFYAQRIKIINSWQSLKNNIYLLIQGKMHWISMLILLLLILQIGVNFIGTLGPEHGFDALWYHLTLPKLYVQNHAITYFPGWLFYYSVMPKLTEMFYVVALLLSNEITAKIIHFLFGILTLITLYKFSRFFLNQIFSLFVLLIFYSNLVVGWMSITAYIDLTRTWYELLSFYYFYLFTQKHQYKYLYFSACLLGFAISIKLVSIGSIIIFLGLIGIYYKDKIRRAISNIIIFLICSIIIPLPWFVYSFIHTKNPIYPLFSGYPLEINLNSLINPINIIKDFWIVFTQSPDPINPIYIIVIPLFFIVYKKFPIKYYPIFQYIILSLFVWYITPRTGGGRFILPFLPLISLGTMLIIKKIYLSHISKILFILILLISCLTIVYRSIANLKYIPALIGTQTKADFLANNLHFDFGDFYDVDGYFSKNIKNSDKILVYGIHNLYYLNFPFIHESYVTNKDRYNYLLITNNYDTTKFVNWKQVYKNKYFILLKQ